MPLPAGERWGRFGKYSVRKPAMPGQASQKHQTWVWRSKNRTTRGWSNWSSLLIREKTGVEKETQEDENEQVTGKR